MSIYVCFAVNCKAFEDSWEEAVCKFLFDLREITFEFATINFAICSLLGDSGTNKFCKIKRWKTLDYSALKSELQFMDGEAKIELLEALDGILWESCLSLQSPCKSILDENIYNRQRRIIVVLDDEPVVMDDNLKMYVERNEIFNVFQISQVKHSSGGNVISISYDYFTNCPFSPVYFCIVPFPHNSCSTRQQSVDNCDVIVNEEEGLVDETILKFTNSHKKTVKLSISKGPFGFLAYFLQKSVKFIKKSEESENKGNELLHDESEQLENRITSVGDIPKAIIRIMNMPIENQLATSVKLFECFQDQFLFSGGLTELEEFSKYLPIDFTTSKDLLSKLHCLFFLNQSQRDILHFLKIYFCLNETESEVFREFLTDVKINEENKKFLLEELQIDSELFELKSPFPRAKYPTNNGKTMRSDSDKIKCTTNESSQKIRRTLTNQFSTSHGEILLSPKSVGLRKDHRKPLTTHKCNQSETLVICAKKVLVPETPFKPMLLNEMKTPKGNDDNEEVFVAETPKKILKCRKRLKF